MAIVALVLSLFVVALGALGIVSPMRLPGIVRQFQRSAGALRCGNPAPSPRHSALAHGTYLALP
jgi:hypothetical protein